MLKLTWAKLNEGPFVQAMITLNGNPKLDIKTAYRVGRICQTAMREMEKARKVENEIKAKYVVDINAKELTWNAPDAQDKFMKEVDEYFQKQEVEIKVHKLEFDKLHGLTGLQLCAIEEIVDGLPEEA